MLKDWKVTMSFNITAYKVINIPSDFYVLHSGTDLVSHTMTRKGHLDIDIYTTMNNSPVKSAGRSYVGLILYKNTEILAEIYSSIIIYSTTSIDYENVAAIGIKTDCEIGDVIKLSGISSLGSVIAESQGGATGMNMMFYNDGVFL